MSKRKRELTQRLEELFSEPTTAQPAETIAAPGEGVAQLAQTLASQSDPNFLAALLDHIPLPIYIKDREHTWVAVNPAFAQMLNRSADQLIGHADKEQSDDEWQNDDRVLETGQPEEIETSVTDFDGSVLRRRVSRVPILDRDGQVRFMIGIGQLTTESKPPIASEIDRGVADDTPSEVFNAADRNRELVVVNQISQILASHSDLRTALKQVGDIVCRLFNVSEGYIALYDRQTNMVGMPYFVEAGQFIDVEPVPLGQGLTSIVIQSRKPLLINRDAESHMRELGAIITGRPAQSYLGVPILAGDEAIGVISIQSIETPGLFDENNLQLLSAIAANMGSAIRNAQLFQEAQQAEQRFRTIADATPIPIMISRVSDGVILYGNQLLGPLMGTSTDELIGGAAPDFYFDPADRNELLEDLRRDGRINNRELHARRIDGTSFWALISLEPIVFNGEPALFSGLYDITERKSVESEVLQRNMQLATLNRISLELARQSDPTAICELIYQEIGQILDNRNLYVALYDEATREVSFPVYTIDGERRPVSSRPFGNGMTEYILRHKAPLLILHDVDAETEKLGIANIGQSAESWMGVPLLAGDKAIGVITLQDYRQAYAYTSDQLELLTTIASQAAIALENARLFTQTQQELVERKRAEAAMQQRAEQLAALNRIGRQLVKLAPVSEILESIYETIGELIDNRNFFIALHDAGDPEIHYPIYTFDNVRSEPFSRPYGKALTEYVLTSKQPVFISHDFDTYLAQIGVESLGRVAQCWIGVPLLVGDKAIGAIALQDYERSDVYTQLDVELLTIIASQAAIALENARLFVQTQARVQELAALNEIGRATSGLLDSTKLLELVYEQVRRVMQVDGFFVGLYDHDRQMFTFPLCYDSGERYTEADSPFDPSTHSAQVVVTGEPMFIQYSAEERQHISTRPETMIGDHAGIPASVMFVPLKIGETVRGIISVQSYESGVHTPDQFNLLINIANQVAVSFENARLFEQTRVRADELSVLNELAQRLSTRLSVEQVLDETYRGVRRLMSAVNFYIGLYDQPKHEVRFLINVTESFVDQQITTISADEGLTGYIIRNRTGLLVRDGIAGWAAKMGMQPVGQNALSWLGVPMIVADQMLGVMAVQSYDQYNAYDEHDRDLLTVFANQAGIAIQNALLFERTQDDARRERTINRISAKIRNTQSVQEILQIAAEELRQATHSARSVALIAPADSTPALHPQPGTSVESAAVDGTPLRDFTAAGQPQP